MDNHVDFLQLNYGDFSLRDANPINSFIYILYVSIRFHVGHCLLSRALSLINTAWSNIVWQKNVHTYQSFGLVLFFAVSAILEKGWRLRVQEEHISL